MESIADRVHDSVIVTTSNTESPGPLIVYVNPAFCKKTGYSPDEVIGESPRMLQGPATERKVLDRLKENLKNNEPFHGSTVNYRKNGSPYVVSWNIDKFWSELYQDYFYISIQKETTREYELDRLNHTMIDSLPDGIIGIDFNYNILSMNPASHDILGCDEDIDISSCSFLDIIDFDGSNTNKPFTDLIERVVDQGISVDSYQDILARKDGEYLWVEVKAQPMFMSSDSKSGGLITIRNISDQKDFEKKMWNAANQDELTRAYNRHFAIDAMHKHTRETKQQGTPLSLIYFDIDNFKTFNDVHGHGVGDEVLKTVVNSVNGRIRKNDYLIRWGGEEFLIILPSETIKTADIIANSIRKQIGDLSIDKDSIGFVESHPTNITISAGVSEFQKDESFETWIERADERLMKAKKKGKNNVVSFDSNEAG